MGRDATTKLSYYVKGPVVGFLLDARIRRVTEGKKSLEDVMRLAYRRYSGERGFTPDQFRATAEEVAGADLKEWFRKALASTEELDYREALDWFGLRFAPSDDPAKAWKLEVREDATDAQKAHLRALLSAARRLVGSSIFISWHRTAPLRAKVRIVRLCKGAGRRTPPAHADRKLRWSTTRPPGTSPADIQSPDRNARGILAGAERRTDRRRSAEVVQHADGAGDVAEQQCPAGGAGMVKYPKNSP